MPWQETHPMLERHHFAHDLESGQWTMTELCERYGISRNTGYKWSHRYRQHGVQGPHDHTRAGYRQSGPAITATPNAQRHRRVDSAGTCTIRVGGPQDLEAPADPGSGAGLARPEHHL
jgi:transposase-like protein